MRPSSAGPAVCATLLAAAAWLATPTLGVRAAAAAPECLAAPGGTPPAGLRWFYRLDHATDRKCWYVRAPSQAATGAAATDAAAPPAEPRPERGARPLSETEREALFRDFVVWRLQHRPGDAPGSLPR